jgi:hypothetical protein
MSLFQLWARDVPPMARFSLDSLLEPIQWWLLS